MTEAGGPIGIIIVSHGKCGAAILQSAESILGAQTDYVTISVDSEQQVEDAVRRLNDAVNILDRGGGVLVLTDMFGGTPTNLALSLLGKNMVELVTGLNLPMLLKVFESREMNDLPGLAAAAAEAGKAGIVITGRMLRNRKRKEQSDLAQ